MIIKKRISFGLIPLINKVSFVGLTVEEEYNPEIVIDDYPLPPSANVPLQTPDSVQEISPPDNDVISPDDDQFDDYTPASPTIDAINELEKPFARATR
jgi:hypothetical protein